MYKIIPLLSKNVIAFWNGLSESFKPGYEIERKHEFVKKVSLQLSNKEPILYQISNEEEELKGGFIKGKIGISYFFIDLTLPDLHEVIEQVIEWVTPHENKIKFFIKERYQDLYLSHGFKSVYARYMMNLNLKQFNNVEDDNLLTKFKIERIPLYNIEKVIDVIFDAYQDTRDATILGYNNDDVIRFHLLNLISGIDKDFLLLSQHSHVLFRKNEIVGTILIVLDLEKPMIYDIAVLKSEQGKKLGKALLLKALGSLKNEFSELKLVVTQGNANAERLYRSVGFKKISDSLIALEKDV
jgi:ribosomal protein S18 acetylase RimI-like enzyme